MGSVWILANINELQFCAAATLLAIKARQQSIATTKQPENELCEESESECDQEEDHVTSKPRGYLTTNSKNGLIDKFLDRFGELFCPEKSSYQHGSQKGAKHVAAAAWIKPGIKCPLIVILAKNEGLDDRDREMAARLQLWLRTVAGTGRHSSVATDIIWIGKLGLVEYSGGRLWYHIIKIKQSNQLIAKIATQSSIYRPVITCLQGLCQKATIDSTKQQLSDIVNIAYMLRHVYLDFRTNRPYMKALRSIGMLARLRGAYECFKSVALTFVELSSMDIRPITFSQPMKMNGGLFRTHLRNLFKEHPAH